MGEFNAKRARAKRPCPLWVDAFQRDTQHLAADEVGAYMLILMAMWTRESCDFPDDDRRLAAVSRVSTRLWKSRVGPVIREFLTAAGGALISDRLRKEATYVERQVSLQSDRKTGEKSANALKDNEPHETADMSTDETTEGTAEVSFPTTQQPTIDGDDNAGARAHDHQPDLATVREQILEAIGVDSTGLTGPNGRIIGRMADMQAYRRWIDDLGLSHPEVLTIIGEVMAQKRAGPDPGPPNAFTYFDRPMREAAAAKARPALTPIAGGRSDDHDRHRHQAGRNTDPRSQALAGMVGSFQRAIDQERESGE